MDRYCELQRQAAQKVNDLLELPIEVDQDKYDHLVEEFDPWKYFPIYGSYDSAFDDCAIEVLTDLMNDTYVRNDLAADMLREMMCKMELCDFGISPGACFPTNEFRPLLPKLIEKWKEYYENHWGDSYEEPSNPC